MVWLCAILCTALWGSAFPAVKTGYRLFSIASEDPASQILFAGLRFFGAGFLALVMGSAVQWRSRAEEAASPSGSREHSLRQGQSSRPGLPILKPRRGSWPGILVLSLFQTALQYILFYVGLAHTTGVKGSILQGTNVLFSLLLVCLLFRRERLSSTKALGCVIGFVGIVLINLTGSGLSFDFTLLGEGFMILASLSYAFSSIFLKQFSAKDDPVMLSGYQFMVGGALMALGAYLCGGRLHTVTPSGLALLLYLAFLSAAAYSLWGILLKHNPVSRITVFTFLTQIFGVLFSSLILKEEGAFGLRSLFALLLVCLGIFLTNREGTRRAA